MIETKPSLFRLYHSFAAFTYQVCSSACATTSRASAGPSAICSFNIATIYTCINRSLFQERNGKRLLMNLKSIRQGVYRRFAKVFYYIPLIVLATSSFLLGFGRVFESFPNPQFKLSFPPIFFGSHLLFILFSRLISNYFS